MFRPNVFAKRPFSNGTGNPAITGGYNMDTYNNPFGNPSTSLGFDGSVTTPNYLDFVNEIINTAISAVTGDSILGAAGSTVLTESPLGTGSKPSPTPKTSFSEKFSNSTFGKNFGAWSSGIGLANNLFTTFAGEKSEYSGTKGGLIRGIDSVYDTAQSAAAMFGPAGQFASLIMGGNKLLGNVANKLGAGTDGRTTTDAILNSSFLLLTPFGMINGFGGKKTMSFTKDNLAFALVGSGYMGTNAKVNKAVDLADKKFGLSSLGALDEANDKIIDASGEQRIMANVADTASDRFALSDSMAAINNSRMALNLMGGYDQSSVRVGKSGMVLQLAREINSRLSDSVLQEVTDIPEEFLEIPEFKEGGLISLNIKDYYKNYDLKDIIIVNDSLPRTEGTTIYSPSDEFTVHELWHYLSLNKPNEALKEFYDSLDDDKLKLFGADLEFVKRTGDPGDFYNPSELEARLKAAKFMSNGSIYDKNFFKNLRDNENKYGDNMRDLLRMFSDDYLEKLFNVPTKFLNGGVLREITEIPIEFLEVSEFKEGGLIISLSILQEVTEIPIEFLEIDEFKKGGKFNIIPEGALHARKHNMDVENITLKGIPVVSESSNGEIVLQAEIERLEIIFRLEVTKKLEELAKDGSDEAAIEAGKLLVQEIIYNTIDNTNTLL